MDEDIKPFRDVLMGLLVTVGMMLDLPLVFRNVVAVAALLLGLLAVKFAVVWGVPRWFGATPGGPCAACGCVPVVSSVWCCCR